MTPWTEHISNGKLLRKKKKRTIILRIRKVKYLKYTRKEVSENLTLTENQG